VSKVWLHFRRHLILSQVREGSIDVRLPDRDLFGDYAILPGRMSEAIGVWMISPAIHKGKHPLRVRVQLVDQFGYSHWTQKITVGFIGDTRRML
jgi:hypothetical protein